MLGSTNNKFAEYRTNREIYPLNVPIRSFGEKLFSIMTPQYERFLMEEIYGLRCVVKFSLDEIMDMPVADRRLYIQLHNQRIEKENAAMNNDDTSTKESIDDVKDLVSKANTKRQENNQ